MSELSDSKVQELLGDFLKSYKTQSGSLKYIERISQMFPIGQKSLIVDHNDLQEFDVNIANMLIQKPDFALKLFNEAAYESIRAENVSYAETYRKEITIRLRHLPLRLELRKVLAKYLGELISVAGIVVRTSELRPMAVEAAFKCPEGHITIVTQSELILRKPKQCEVCNERKFFEFDQKRTVFSDYQEIRLQELPEELPPGQLPQMCDVSLFGDLVDIARPGDHVTVNGVLRAHPETTRGSEQLRFFRSRIEANFVEQIGQEEEQIQLTKEDEAIIRDIASQPGAYDRLIESIAPAIHGITTQKEAILLQIVGSPQRHLSDGTSLRGDINMLLVGDPGTAKSELLKYVSRIAPRAVYTSGKGSTAAGLTAAVVKEKSGIMMLEAGAVVLADLGIACIDEFDKMRTEDRNALHECMEQQTCSVAKGGIVATLNARTSILAAANPIFGKYDPYHNITENVSLPIPLLTRFDLIFIMQDVPDRSTDEKVARHILETHRKGSFVKTPPIDYDLLRKYIIFVRHTEPVLTKEAEDKIIEYYLKMRNLGEESMITVTPRQLEALVRLATARARLMLKDQVSEDDALRAVSLVERMLTTVGVDVKTGKVDVGVFHGRPLSERTLLETALDIFKSLQGSDHKPVDGKIFVDELVKTDKFKVEEAQRMLQTLHRSGQIYEVNSGQYRKL